MKKLIIPVFILCLLLTMTACGGDDADQAGAEDNTPVQAASGAEDNTPAQAASFAEDNAPAQAASGADQSAAEALVDALRGSDSAADTAAGGLPDPGGLLSTAAVQLADQTVNGTVFHVYEYTFDAQNGISSIQRSFYESKLKDSGFTMEELESDDDLNYYFIHGGDGTATLTTTKASPVGRATWTLYVPETIPFSPGQSGSGSSQNGSGVSGSSFQNGSYVPGGITGGSFQNGSYTAGAEDPKVVDGLLICTGCHGSGICAYCHGVGQVKYDMKNYETCVNCDGTGECALCDGTGNWGPA